MTYGSRLQKALSNARKTRKDLATALGCTPQAIGMVITGGGKAERMLSTENNAKAADFLRVNPNWLATGYGEMLLQSNNPYHTQDAFTVHSAREPEPIYLINNPEFPAIRRVSIKAQAGVSGYAVEYINDDGPPIVFRRDWYAMHGYRPEKLLAMRIAGESMVPSIYPDDLVVVNTAQLEPKDGIAFAVAYEGEVVVKRLIRDAGQWWLSSDNQDQRRYPRKVCNGDTQIIGEVVYRQTERI